MIWLFVLSILLLSGLGWMIIGTGANWKIKLVFITLAIYLPLSVFSSFESFKGWASNDSLPGKFTVQWAIVEEPEADTDGAVYLWITSFEYPEGCGTLFLCLNEVSHGKPRAYALPYSEELHQQVNGMMELIVLGNLIEGQNSEQNGFGDSIIINEYFEAREIPVFRDRMPKNYAE